MGRVHGLSPQEPISLLPQRLDRELPDQGPLTVSGDNGTALSTPNVHLPPPMDFDHASGTIENRVYLPAGPSLKE
jgi:hypothetical protein